VRFLCVSLRYDNVLAALKIVVTEGFEQNWSQWLRQSV